MYLAMPGRPAGVPGLASWLTNWSLIASRRAAMSLAGKISSRTRRARVLLSVPVIVASSAGRARHPIFVAVSFSLMSEEARPRRRYDATGRRRRAEETRSRVVEAARRGVLARGHAGGTIPPGAPGGGGAAAD